MLLLCLLGTSLFPQDPSAQVSEVRVTAEKKDWTQDTIRAWGDVKVEYKDMKLFADYVEVNTETKDFFAKGNVAFHLPNEVHSMDEIQGNLDEKRGILTHVHGQVQPDITYEAESVERVDDEVYQLQKAWVTSCTQPTPRWRFNCTKANFKRDDYIEMWSPVFRIKKVPIFWFPYIRYPLDQDRATGFLFPNAGYNGQKGFHISQAFFWAIRRNMDATFNLDYFSQRGMGAAGEYRYRFPGGMGGELNLYYFKFNNQAPYDEDNAYIIRFKHNQPLPAKFRLVADVDYQSSFDFLREFDNNFKRAVVSNRSSQVYLSRSWSYFNWNVRVSRFETYYKANNRSIIRNNLPEMGFTSSKIKLVEPLYFSFNTSFNRWEYGWNNEYENGTQKKSQSFLFIPTLSLPFNAIPWLNINTSLSTNLNYYFQSYRPSTKEVINEPFFSQNSTIDISLTGPVFQRIFFNKDDIPKLKHIIEPEFQYRYETPVADSDRIIVPRFFYRYHFISYGLVNHVLVKKGTATREIFTLGVGQRFYLEPEEGPLQNYEVDGEVPAFGDISGYLRYFPGSRYSIDFSAGFNVYENSFSRLRLGLNYGNPADDFFLRVNWYKSTDPFRQETAFSRHQINFYTGIKIPRLSLETQIEMDYNIREKELLYTAFAFVYTYQCLDFMGGIRVFYFRDKPEAQFNFTVGLGNIGKSPDVLGGMGF
jgi:lipopolysaccharide assembly outer membrane protein LptD (OstA)